MPKPNAKGKLALFIIAMIVTLVIGFILGQVGNSMMSLPGNADDPVATQSYVEVTVGERLAVLTTRIEELEAELATLKGTGQVTPSGGDTQQPSGSGDTTPPSTSTRTLTITGTTVNVRSGPSTDHAILTQLAAGDKVTWLATEGEWYKIQTGSTTGYVASYLAE